MPMPSVMQLSTNILKEFRLLKQHSMVKSWIYQFLKKALYLIKQILLIFRMEWYESWESVSFGDEKNRRQNE